MYIIKKHYEATETNLNHAGVIIDYYEGRGGHILSKNQLPSQWEAQEYGYKTLASAKRGLRAVQELCDSEAAWGHWRVSAELVQV